MTDTYATVAENYDIMIDWPARLARERPFLERMLGECRVRRVLDVGSATGHHARLFAELGAEVIGLDPSRAMLERARQLTPGENPRFLEGGFAEIPLLPGRFDLMAALGNTLAHVQDARGLGLALRAMRRGLDPAGRLCIQVINYDSLIAAGSRWLPVVHRQMGDREYLFLREHRYVEGRAEFTIITLIRDGEWRQHYERNPHVPLTAELLQRALTRAGFRALEFYGDFQRTPFTPSESPNLVALARTG